MDFSDALKACKQGKKIARYEWIKRKEWIDLGQTFSKSTANDDGRKQRVIEAFNVGGHVFILHTANGEANGWLPSTADLLADDWAVYVEAEKNE